jgi:molybdate transport system substrate-binding protein
LIPRAFAFFILIFLGFAAPVHARQRGPVILAASSLQEALNEAADRWAAKKQARPIISFAGSPALARQIEAGAPADIFISADNEWMNYVAAKGLIRPRTRAILVGNQLVLVAPASSGARLTIRPSFALAHALGNGRLAMANPDSVPAGRYGKAALVNLGVWPSVAGKIVRAENVRAALALVERGEAPFGIVYASDAKASRKVRIMGIFPKSSHPPITYPLAILKTSTNHDAEGFRRFLLSREGLAIFVRRGFTPRTGLN